MQLHTLAAIALAALIVTTGAAVAAPGNAPDVPGADDAHGVSDDVRDGEPDENASAAAGDVSPTHVQGPPADLPAQVPDHVAQLHDLIRQFLDGTLEGSLGEAISGVTPDDESATADGSAASG